MSDGGRTVRREETQGNGRSYIIKHKDKSIHIKLKFLLLLYTPFNFPFTCIRLCFLIRLTLHLGHRDTLTDLDAMQTRTVRLELETKTKIIKLHRHEQVSI